MGSLAIDESNVIIEPEVKATKPVTRIQCYWFTLRM
jgi:hypothetical protein